MSGGYFKRMQDDTASPAALPLTQPHSRASCEDVKCARQCAAGKPVASSAAVTRCGARASASTPLLSHRCSRYDLTYYAASLSLWFTYLVIPFVLPCLSCRTSAPAIVRCVSCTGISCGGLGRSCSVPTTCEGVRRWCTWRVARAVHHTVIDGVKDWVELLFSAAFLCTACLFLRVCS